MNDPFEQQEVMEGAHNAWEQFAKTAKIASDDPEFPSEVPALWMMPFHAGYIAGRIDANMSLHHMVTEHPEPYMDPPAIKVAALVAARQYLANVRAETVDARVVMMAVHQAVELMAGHLAKDPSEAAPPKRKRWWQRAR